MLKQIITTAILCAFTYMTKAQDTKGNIEKPSYKITEQTANKAFSELNFTIKDQSGYPNPGYVCLRNGEGKRILQCLADNTGKVSIMLFDLSMIKSITVDYLGYSGVEIPIPLIKNKTSSIEVKLIGQGTEN